MSILDRIATIPPVVIPDENRVEISWGNLLKISGTSSTDKPNEKLNAITKIDNMNETFAEM